MEALRSLEGAGEWVAWCLKRVSGHLRAKLKGTMGSGRQGSEKQEESWTIVTSWKPRGENFKKGVWQPSHRGCRPVSRGACLLRDGHGAERPYTVVPSVLAGVPGKAVTVTSEGWMTRALAREADGASHEQAGLSPTSACTSCVNSCKVLASCPPNEI